MKRSNSSRVSALGRASLCSMALIGGILGGPQMMPIAPMAYGQSSTTGGYSLLAEDRVDEAIAVFEQLVRQNPSDLEALLGLGIAYRRAGQDERAFDVYQRAVELDPNNQVALGALGFLGEFRSTWQATGIEALTRLLQLEPSAFDARAQRAKLYYFQGRFSEALADYAIVLPQLTGRDVLRPAAEAYTYSGDYATGLSLFERYRRAGGAIEGDAAIAYAFALRSSGQLTQAIQILQQELGRTPAFNTQHIRLRGALASAYAASGQIQPALDLVQPLRGRLDSRLTLARALNTIGSFSGLDRYNQEAAALYQEVLATGPGVTPGIQREAIAVFSSLSELQPTALQLTQQLTSTLPNDVSLTLQQQVLAYQVGRLGRAEFVQQVRNTFPGLPSDSVAVRQMSQVLSRLDPPVAELLPLYRSLIAAGTTDAFLNFRVAQILSEQGQLTEARAAIATYAATPVGSQDTETVQLILADIDRQEGNLAQSGQRYQAVLSAAQSPSVRNAAAQGLATVYQNQGLFAEAIAVYDQLIRENPQDFTYQLGRTAIAYQGGFVTEAQADLALQQGLQLYAGAAPPPELITLATVLPANASRANVYQQLLTADPTNTQLQLRSLQLLAATNPRQAQLQIAQLIAQNPTALDLYFVQGEIAQQVEDYDLARQSYLIVLQQQPNRFDALLALAGLEFQQGNYEQASFIYQQALAIDAENSTAVTSLAALNAVQGRSLAAIQQLRAWQQQQLLQGTNDPQVAEQIQRIEEGLLQQRGIQPEWERF